MSAIGSCCDACPPFTPPVNIPGSAGEAGIPGVNGVNSFSTIASFQGVGFVVPAVGSSATIYITDTGEWMAINQPVYISGAGQYQVTTTASVGANGTSVQLKNLGSSGNAVPGSAISAGNTISPSGLQGYNSYTVTTATFTWGAYGTTSTLTAQNVAWMIQNQIVYAQGAGYFQVAAPPNTTNGTVSLTNLAYAGNSTSGSIGSGAGVSPAGVQGSLPLPSPQVFYSNSLTVNLTSAMTNIGSAQVTLPAAGTWQIIALMGGTYFCNQGVAQPTVIAQLEAQPSGSGIFNVIPQTNVTRKQEVNGSSNLSGGFSVAVPVAIYSTATIGDVIGVFAQYGVTASTVQQVTDVSLVAVCINLTT